MRERGASGWRWLVLGIALIAPLATAGPPDEPAEPAGATTPRAAVDGFLDSAEQGDYARAAAFLDLSAWPEDSRAAEGAALARQLHLVLEQTHAVQLDQLSDEPKGRADDDLPARAERVGRIATKSGEVDIILRRQGGEDDAGWLFSTATLRRVPALYEEHGYGVLGDLLPAPFLKSEFLDLRLWQWAGLLLVVLVAWLLSWLAVRLVYAVLRPLVGLTETTLDNRLLDVLMSPLRLLAGVVIFAVGVLPLGLSLEVREVLHNLQRGLAVVAFAWLFMRLVDMGGALLRERLESSGRQAALTVLPLGEKAVKVVVLGLAFLMMLQNLGFNVTGVIAGLGIGGLALALAAQKTVENLFGGVSLIMDQPVRVGDFCKYGDRVGTVEDIGLRSTRVRSLDRTIVTVPNANFAYLQLENFADRERILFNPTLGLRRETTPDQLRWVLAGARRLLASHPRVDKDGHVRLVACKESSLDVEIFAYVTTTDWEEFLAIQEDLYLRLLDVVAAGGTALAVPTRVTYQRPDAGPDEERRLAAENEVQGWREHDALPFPDFAEGEKEQFEKVDWPPKGSAVASNGGKDQRNETRARSSD
jgi:MscS family membrane protein